MNDKEFKTWLKNTKPALPSSIYVGFAGVVLFPALQIYLGSESTLLDGLWFASFGFVGGGLWQSVHEQQKQRINNALDTEISKST